MRQGGGKSLSCLFTCLTQHTAECALAPVAPSDTTPERERKKKTETISWPGRHRRSPETWLPGMCWRVKEESGVKTTADEQPEVRCRRRVQEEHA